MAAEGSTGNGRAQSAPASAPAASPFSAPQIELPKGGGAIRGIDQKFAANPATGTGSLSIPIAASPGRSGFGPQLAVSYDSGAGNGIFGMGWSLSQQAITRRVDKGNPRYDDGAPPHRADIFVLSGAEDLVSALRPGTSQPDEFERHGHRVQRYRPRIEGLFARIERWTSLADGSEHWRSISKDNVLTVYGLDAQSRIADPEHPERVFSWLICRSYDDKGNAIRYDYVGENDAGVDTTKNGERGRIRTANRYPKRIRYGNRVPLLLDLERDGARRCHLEPHDLDAAQWMFELVFDYGEGHYREAPPDADGRILAQADVAAAHDWPTRRDPFSSYRSAFEIRTHRLCRRVLMFHRFPQELRTDACLVRSTAFHYLEKPVGSFVAEVVQSGHARIESDGRYLTRHVPPLEFSYSASPLEDADVGDYPVQEIDAESLANLPGGIDGGDYRLLDLDGEGIAGILTEQGDAWLYKRNLGNGRFGAAEIVRRKPSLAALAGGAQMLMDVAGDGNLDLVDLAPSAAGFQERTADAGWEAFRPFRSLPVRDWGDPNLRFVDLTGDGVADVLVTEDDALTWHPSLLQDGFGPGLRVRVPLDEDAGARVVFADETQSIYLADMSGGGLSDIVRIRNRDICYWPNLGYGRFGAKITMANAPRFDTTDLFDQRRLHLADTDGSGTSDLLYFDDDGVRIYLNETGNGWSHARHLRQFPGADNAGSITVTDLLGRGTACLLWSSPLPRDAGRQLRYVDLMRGQKPHLLTGVVNNLGAETRITYASSTEFYLADKAAGTPWVTRLPFPVHVVTRVETYDWVSRNRFVARYAYHHGYYDGVEREFRGFGRVDQIDTEEFATLTAGGDFPVGDNIDAASSMPPVLTKTWLHTGAYIQGEAISRHLAHEYYLEGDGLGRRGRLAPDQMRAMLLDDTVLPKGLTADEAREACRSLKGAMLRQEVFALEGTEAAQRPYSVAEANFTIRPLQRRGNNRHAVFFTHPREALSFNYERKLYAVDDGLRADPRVSHSITLEVDAYGNVTKSASVGYGRRFPDPSPLLTDADREKQSQILVTIAQNDYTNAVDEHDAFRTPLSSQSRSYELVGARPRSAVRGITNLFRFHEFAETVARVSDGAHDLTVEDWRARRAVASVPCRRLLKQRRSLYRSDRLDRILPFGAAQALALPGESYQLAFTSGLLASVYARNTPDGAPEALLPEPAAVLASRGADGGGYVDLDGDGRWWAPSGKVYFHVDPEADPARERDEAARHFFLPRRFEDPFGYCTTAEYDPHDVMATRTVDAVGNLVRAEHDYRVLQPRLVTDPNGNRSEAAFDAVGLVVGSAVMGKATENLGDSLEGFRADLTQADIDELFADPKGPTAAALLGRATSRIVYDHDRFHRTKAGNPNHPNRWQPAFGATLSRETHDSDLPQGQQSKIQLSFGFSDGFGREIQKKVQAEPGPIMADGAIVNPRWIGSGWSIFNNKGKPVRQYEPFFDDTHDFRFGHKVGVSPISLYDPLDRVVATVNPDHTWQKAVVDPWRQVSWDVNDTVLIANPRNDADVGDFFRRLPDTDFLPTWYEARACGTLGEDERNAARKASVHAGTPSVAFSDSLGRSFLNYAHNRYAHNRLKRKDQSASEPPVEELFATRVVTDIEGNLREVIDAKGRAVMRHCYDLLGNRIRQMSMEAGARWTLNDVSGKPIRAWDSRYHQFRSTYDALRRPVGSFLCAGENIELMIGRTAYGEACPDPELSNLRGKVVQVFDQAGVTDSNEYDFKGNALRGQRQLAREYKQTLDWSSTTVLLEDAVYANATSYDALNRPTALTFPDHSVIIPGYNDGNLLERVDVRLRGAEVATSFVTNVDYNAKGQRVLIVYGNGARTSHAYDPLTFRLTHLLTCRDQAAFPDDCPQPPPSGWPGCQIQRLTYTYDAKGNITHIRDDAQQTIFFRGRRVEPSSDYTYDAVYRLIEAAGREHLGQVGGSLTALSHNDEPRVSLPHPGDGNAMGRYAERYTYDVVGNILAMQHRGADSAQPAWTRSYSYDEPSQLQASQTSNRLSRTEVGETIERYRYDGSAGLHGNMTSMPHLPLMQWDFRDRLQATARQVVKDGTPETTWYVYDAAGLRVRKVTERHAPDGRSPGRSKERIYLGGFEIYREYESDAETVNLARETLHVMGGQERVALVETRTHGHDPSPAQLIRYQLGNHLGSVCLELDAHAQIISCEEYTPYGSSSYQAVRSRSEAPKRYRFTGKERDEESGLGYHGARYYAPWLGRWASPDPAGLVDGANVYAYARDNPLSYADASGTQCDPETQTCIDPAQPTPREQALQQSLPDDERDEPPPDDQSSTPPADLSSSNQSASTSLTISTSQYAISVLVRPVDVNGQPVKGTYYLWSGELNKDAAKAMIAKEGGWLMSQTPEHVVAAGQFAAALRREAATLFPGQAFTDQELFAKAGTEIRLSDAEMSAIWDAPSADIARRAVVGGLPVQGNLVTPPGPKTVQTRIEGPTVGEAGTLMGGVQIFAGGLNVYGATQEQDPALSTLGFVGGGLQIAGGATLIQGAVKLSGPAMAAGSRLALVGAVITAPITIAHATADLQSGDQYREMRGTLNMVGIVAPPAAFLATYNDVFVKPAAETFYETARRDIANMMGVPQSWVY